MHSGTARRSLSDTFGTKMAAAPPHTAPDRLASAQAATSSHSQLLGLSVSTASLGPVSPAFTESLLDQTLKELGLSPMEASPPQSQQLLQPGDSGLVLPVSVADMFSKFAELLDRGLQHTAIKITNDIKADLHTIGSRVEILENNLESTIARTNQNTSCIQTARSTRDSQC